MRKLIVTLVASACAFGLAAPAMAPPDDGNDEHEEVHDQLNAQHDAGHDTLDAFHAQAHQHGMDPWEHMQLHRFLDRQHARMHDQLNPQHYQCHYPTWGGYYGDVYRPYYGY